MRIARAVTLAALVLATAGMRRTPLLDETGILGSPLGSRFDVRCPGGSVLVAVGAEHGMWLHQLRIKCQQVASNGSLGTVVDAAGDAGSPYALNQLSYGEARCPSGKVVGAFQISHSIYVHRITLRCYPWKASERKFDRFGTESAVKVSGTHTGSESKGAECPGATKPATGIIGRDGTYIDAFGLRCTVP
jgi:hypothetical protein